MTITIITFTKKARELALHIKELLKEEHVILFDARKGKEEISVSDWIKQQFEMRNVICFIGACQIAVRMIAPFLQNKLTDSPVIVIDEKGEYVIPVLSGHIGGANEFSRRVACLLQATPVITTATDINKQFAIDLFAKESGLTIVNKEGIATVSGKVLEGKTLTIQISSRISRCYEQQDNKFVIGHYTWMIPEHMTRVSSDYEAGVDIFIGDRKEKNNATLYLSPREYVLGIGCKKDKAFADIHHFVLTQLEENNLSMTDICAIVSIERKKEEAGILTLSQKYQIPFFTYAKEELEATKGEYTASSFVQSVVGVDNVCERACMVYCKEKGEVVLPKNAKNGITMSIFKMKGVT